jgi:hypothetical protein
MFALDLRFRNIVMEGDSLNVVRTLNTYVVDYSCIDLLIDDCHNIRSSFSNCLVEHLKRTSNVSVYHLAKFVLSSVDTI